MEEKLHQPRHSLRTFVALEKQIWDAFVDGDMQKDASLLSDDFLGIYPDGNLDKEGHYRQLENGPIVASYELRNEKIEVLSDGQVELSYRAVWVRKGGDPERPEVMDVWSKWKNIDGQWQNTESRDVPVAS